MITFEDDFKSLTGNAPFPWQCALYEKFCAGDIPSSCNLPTGLGKTSVLAIWLLAWATNEKLPRRLVYVVNRRTVVDQTTDEAENLRKNLDKVPGLRKKIGPLPISTLRGQFADNREWSADPSRPAIIVGTVEMIGSRLLFSGYGVGFKMKPLHAGFLGQDVLLVHDEAHLEPAFQELIVAVKAEQDRCKEFQAFCVMELSATSRGSGGVFGLTASDRSNAEVIKRIEAHKSISLHPCEERKLADEIVRAALEKFKDSNRAVLVFVRKVDDVEKIVSKLKASKQKVQQLTGTLRGLERDKLATEDKIFARFLPKAATADETVYLVCTSAGEVGVNISADHLVCDLSTFESMAQRFGRVNRFGDRDDTEIHIVHPTVFDEKSKVDPHREKTLALLKKLNGDGSPKALGAVDLDERLAAFAPQPRILKTSDILFDAWALTTISGKLPGRPAVEPYLHGVSEWEPPETHVAWRTEVEVIEGDLLKRYSRKDLKDLLEDYPLKPHELLRDNMPRIRGHIDKIALRFPKRHAWIVNENGDVREELLENLRRTEKRNGKTEYVVDSADCTVLLPPDVGGLQDGLLAGESVTANDVADELFDDQKRHRRQRIRSEDPTPSRVQGMRLIREIDTRPSEDEEETPAEAEESADGLEQLNKPRFWRWYVRLRTADDESSKTSEEPIPWQAHTDDVAANARKIVEPLPLPGGIKAAIILAAEFHDLGKRRELWQRSIGNPEPTNWLAKSGGKMIPRDLGEKYRHEFGSLLDIQSEAKFNALNADMQEFVLHLIAAHHGYGRPHFPQEYVFDPQPNDRNVEAVAFEVPRRFALLQRKYGRWGLAYLESLLRAADYAASANPSSTVEGK